MAGCDISFSHFYNMCVDIICIPQIAIEDSRGYM